MDILDYLVIEIEKYGITADARYAGNGIVILLWPGDRKEEIHIDHPTKPLGHLANDLVHSFLKANPK